MMLRLIDMTSHDGDNLSLRRRRTNCKMSDNYLSRICLYKCVWEGTNHVWIIHGSSKTLNITNIAFRFSKCWPPLSRLLALDIWVIRCAYIWQLDSFMPGFGIHQWPTIHLNTPLPHNFQLFIRKKVQRNDLLRARFICSSRISKLHTWEKSCLAFTSWFT